MDIETKLGRPSMETAPTAKTFLLRLLICSCFCRRTGRAREPCAICAQAHPLLVVVLLRACSVLWRATRWPLSRGLRNRGPGGGTSKQGS